MLAPQNCVCTSQSSRTNSKTFSIAASSALLDSAISPRSSAFRDRGA
jgi:hypothetical protein